MQYRILLAACLATGAIACEKEQAKPMLAASDNPRQEKSPAESPTLWVLPRSRAGFSVDPDAAPGGFPSEDIEEVTMMPVVDQTPTHFQVRIESDDATMNAYVHRESLRPFITARSPLHVDGKRTNAHLEVGTLVKEVARDETWATVELTQSLGKIELLGQVPSAYVGVAGSDAAVRAKCEPLTGKVIQSPDGWLYDEIGVRVARSRESDNSFLGELGEKVGEYQRVKLAGCSIKGDTWIRAESVSSNSIRIGDKYLIASDHRLLGDEHEVPAGTCIVDQAGEVVGSFHKTARVYESFPGFIAAPGMTVPKDAWREGTLRYLHGGHIIDLRIADCPP